MKKRKISLQKKFMLYIFLVSAIPLIILPFIGYTYTEKILTKKIEENSKQTLEQMVNEFDEILNKIIIVSNFINLNKEIENEIQEIGENKSLFSGKSINEALLTAQTSNLYLYDVETCFFDFYGDYYSASNKRYNYDRVKESRWFKEALENNGFFIWNGPANSVLDFEDGIALTRLIKTSSGQKLGVLAIYLSQHDINNILANGGEYKNSYSFLINEKQEIIGGTVKDNYILSSMKLLDREGKYTIKGEDVFVICSAIDKTNWSLVQITPYKSLTYEVKQYRDFIFTINIVFIFIIIFTAYLTSRHTTREINILNVSVEKIIRGNLNAYVTPRGSLEVVQLSTNFNYMIDEINRLIENVRSEEKEKVENRLYALKSQISPHFILNTLNGIKWLCIIEDAKTSEEMIVALGVILEKTLGHDKISIEEEIKCIEYYIKIQKMRYGKKIKVNINFDDDILHCFIPVLLIQPIVENSIIHGFEDEMYGGIIDISIKNRKKYISIIITDNGKGIEKEKINKLLTTEYKRSESQSIGVNNVYSRIKFNYKKPCGMWMTSTTVGTSTIILLRKDEEN
ncbi:MAG: sensor histidine kinase [Lachnospirales bacterium]